MTIAIDVRSLLAAEPTGVGAYIKELVAALKNNSSTTEFVLFSNAYGLPAPLATNDERIKIAHYNIPNKIFNTALVTRALKLDSFLMSKLNLDRIDHWFAPNLHFSPLSPKTPLTLTIHDLTFDQMPSWYSGRQRIKHYLANAKHQVARANLILTPSNNTGDDVSTYLNGDRQKIHTLYPALNAPIREFLAEGPEIRVERLRQVKEKYLLPNKYLLFLGALEPRKNIQAAICAFELALNKLPDNYYLILAGSHGWQNETLFRALENSSAKKRIRYLGYLPENEKASLIAQATLLVYPSFYEGFGFPVLDALALGVPVVTSPRASLFEVAADAAYYAHPERPSEIATGFATIINNQNLRAKKIALGLAQASKFSWDLTAKSLLNLWGAR